MGTKEQRRATQSQYWLIPPEIYGPLNCEFNFDFDPCPYKEKQEDIIDAIGVEWGQRNWVNPPFRKADAFNGHGPTDFVRKAIEESRKGKTSVLILPVQNYVNMLLQAGAELRPVGRVKWIDGRNKANKFAPSNNALFILKGKEASP